MIILLFVGTITIAILYNNDSFKKRLGIDTRKEVKYDGSEDFSYEKGVRCEDVLIDYFSNRRSYVKNQVTFFCKSDTAFNEVRELLKKYDGIIVGYKAKTNFYQVEFLESTIEELKSKVRRLNNEELVEEYSASLNTDFILETIKSKYSKDKRVEINYTNGVEFSYMTRGKVVTHKIEEDNGEEREIYYMDNLIQFLVDEKYSLDDVKEMARKYGGVVVGYSPSNSIHSCEVEFLNCDYEKLQEKIQLINSEPMLEGAHAVIRLTGAPTEYEAE